MKDERMVKTTSGKAAVGTFLGVSGLVVLLTSSTLGLYFFGTTSWLTLGPIGISLVFIAAWFTLTYQKLTERLSQRQAQYFGLTAGYTATLLAFLAGGHYLLSRDPVTFDLSSAGVHTLSEQTKKTLASLTDEVRVTAFLEPSDPANGVFDMMAMKYRRESDKVIFRTLSPSYELEEVRRYKVTSETPPIIAETHWEDPIRRKDARFRIEMRELNHEETFTNAIISASLKSRPKVLFMSGHGESDVSDGSPNGLREAVSDMRNEGYDVIPFTFSKVGAIPDDIALLVIAGPKSALLEPEVAAVKKFAEDGGHMLLMLEPMVETGLAPVAGAFGVQVNNDIIIDISPFGRLYGDRTAIASDYGAHIIVDKFANNMSIFPEARSLSENPGTGAFTTPLMRTAERAWGETDFAGLSDGNAQWDAGEARGPVTLAIASERIIDEEKGTRARIVVLGDASFATNEHRRLGTNRNLFLNIIGWLVEDDSRIAVRPRTRGGNLITLTPAQREGISFFVLYVLPVSLLAMGLGIWLVRRQR